MREVIWESVITLVELKRVVAHFLRVYWIATSCLSRVDLFPEKAYGASP